MDIQTFWEWLTGQTPAEPAPSLNRGHLPSPDPEGGEVGTVLQAGDSSCVVYFQRLGVQVEIPKQQLTNPRPGQKVRIVPNATGQQVQTNRTPTHNARPLAIPQGAGVPPAVVSWQGPQRFQFLWRPTLDRVNVAGPYFSAQQLGPYYSDSSPRFSEPLDDLGQRHPHYLSYESSTAWRKINHSTRTAFMPDYATSTDTIFNSASEKGEHIVPTMTDGLNDDYLPPPAGNQTLSEWQTGYPQITTDRVFRGDQVYMQIESEGAGAAIVHSTYWRQGSTLDYATGTVTEDAQTAQSTASEWRTGTLYMESWEYLDPPLMEPRRRIWYRDAPTSLRIVMVYRSEFDGNLGQYVMVPDHAQWQGYDSNTEEWWVIGNYVDVGGLELFSLGNLPPGVINYSEGDWADPVPSCDPDTGEFEVGTNVRHGNPFANSVPIAYPTGNPAPTPDPPIEWRPEFTSPDLEGQFTIQNTSSLFGWGEHGEGGIATVNGQTFEGWAYWAALRHVQPGQSDKQTLLLCRPEDITILLDLGEPQTFEWPEFWQSLGLPDDLTFEAATSPFAHHSFPLDRCYLAVSREGQGYAIGIGHLNPWRDLSQKQWKSQGLSKPKTWAKYLSYTDSKPTTLTGLVCTDVIPMDIPWAWKPAYGGGTEDLPFKAIPFQMLPIPKDEPAQAVPTSVEILEWTGPPEGKAAAEARALEALSRRWDLPGWPQDFPEDTSSIGPGTYRLTFPAIPVSGLTQVQLLGRGKGKLSSLRQGDGTSFTADWIGYGLQPKQQGKAVQPTGWHPFSAVHPATINPSEGLTLTLQVQGGLRISQLIWTVTAIQD